jgi:hypothetical protein
MNNVNRTIPHSRTYNLQAVVCVPSTIRESKLLDPRALRTMRMLFYRLSVSLSVILSLSIGTAFLAPRLPWTASSSVPEVCTTMLHCILLLSAQSAAQMSRCSNRFQVHV